MRIYISGTISDGDTLPPKEIEKNVEKFHIFERKIRSIGHIPVNPINFSHNHNKAWKDYIVEDIRELLDCEAIFMINGWQNSKGARLERGVAFSLEMLVLDERWIEDIINRS